MARSLVLGRPGLFYGSAVRDYLDRVRAADNAGLSRDVTNGINAYISGLISANLLGTSDGVVSQAASTIKAHCILAGANTLSGCLVPVVGPAPTNVNFVPADYNRKTGLGDSSNATKYLNTNRNNNAEPQNNQHMSVYCSAVPTASTRMLIGAGGSTGAVGATHMNLITGPGINTRNRNSTTSSVGGAGLALGFYGMNRQSSTSYNYRFPSGAGSISITSQAPFNGNIQVFANEGTLHYNGRFSFYTISEGLDLAVLQSLQDQFMATLNAAIP